MSDSGGYGERNPLERQVRPRVGRGLRQKWRPGALLGFGGLPAVYAATHWNDNRAIALWYRLALMAALVSLACGGSAVTSGDGAGEKDGEAGAPPIESGVTTDSGMSCPSLPGPSMVALPEGYCIDSTEVTRAQYAAWLETNPDPGSPIGVCSWKDGFTPGDGCVDFFECPADSDCSSWPQTCVDWCDAYSYCVGIGKRLCGKIGGGTNDASDFADPTKSQWYGACTSGGKHAFPYGDVCDSSACNGKEFELDDWGSPAPVASMASCQSSEPGYRGVFDLSGNVVEFEDSCEGTTGVDDRCRTRGDGFVNDDQVSSYMRCDRDMTATSRNTVAVGLGFRCCYP